MKIALVMAGSGGHIIPAKVLKDYLEKNHEEVIFLCEDKRISHLLLEKEKTTFFCSKRIITNIGKILKVIFSCQVIIGFGGKLSFLTLLSGRLLRKKVFLHEQNCIGGKGNRYATTFIRASFTSFVDTTKLRKKIYVGNPVEDSFNKIPLQRQMNNILLLAGSLGSSELKNLYLSLAEVFPELTFTLVSGSNNNCTIKGANLIVVPFIERRDYINYDFVLTRAGASSIAEMLKIGMPMILLPSKNVTENHQEINAHYISTMTTIKTLTREELSLTSLTQLLTNYKSYLERYELVSSYSPLVCYHVCARIYEKIKK